MRHRIRLSSRRALGTLSAEIQSLEPRTLPAGTVTASLSGGSITLTGDKQDNAIAIQMTPTGVFVQSTDGSTTIKLGAQSTTDGSPVKLAAGPKVFQDLIINLNDGNDTVYIFANSFPLGAVGVAAAVEAPLEATIGRNLKINTGRGNDGVVVFAVGGRLTVGNDMTVELGSGDDLLFLYGAISEPPSDLPAGPPTPQVNPLHVTGNAKINGGAGNDVIQVFGVSTGKDLQIETFNGNDQVIVVNSSIGGNVGISTGGDDDFVVASDVAVFGRSSITTGNGNDHVEIHNAYSRGNVSVRLDQGNDTLDVSGNLSVGKNATVTLDGGDGRNEIDTFNTDNPDSDLARRAMIIAFEEFGASPAG